MSKQPRYFYDAAAIAEEAITVGDTRHLRTDRTAAVGLENGWRGGGRDLTGKPQADIRNARDVWTIATQPFSEAHFATFPPELAERCIKAGTSEKGCCAKCGKPWERKVERETVNRSNAAKAGTVIVGKGHVSSQVREGHDIRNGPTSITQTLVWAPACACEAPAVPCTVLDPFGGSGTSGLVADRLQRNAVLIEMNREYAAMAKRRMTNDAPLFAEVAL
jgi:hypothetical protein